MTQDTSKFTSRETETIRAVLDELVPPSADGKLPGAGTLGVVAYVEAALAKAPELRAMIVQGLAELEDTSRQRHGHQFAALSREQKVALLNEQGFIFPLMLHTFVGYYQDPKVVTALGLPPRPPHPKGYEMEPNDLSLLEPVRRRSKLYREV